MELVSFASTGLGRQEALFAQDHSAPLFLRADLWHSARGSHNDRDIRFRSKEPRGPFRVNDSVSACESPHDVYDLASSTFGSDDADAHL